MDNSINVYPRGSHVTAELDHLLGMEKVFKNIDPSAPKVTVDSSDVRCQWVRNGSGTTIAKNVTLKWVSGYEGLRVQIGGDNDKICGVADEFLTTTVADGEYFWMVADGYNGMISDGGGALAQGDVVVAAASGEVNIQTAAPADTTAAMVQVNSVVGTVRGTVAATAHLAFRGKVKVPHN